jgi:hypothetical protein
MYCDYIVISSLEIIFTNNKKVSFDSKPKCAYFQDYETIDYIQNKYNNSILIYENGYWLNRKYRFLENALIYLDIHICNVKSIVENVYVIEKK